MKNLLANGEKTPKSGEAGRWSRRIGAVVLATVGFFVAADVSATPTLWGVDEDGSELFSIGDYNNPSGTFTSYGRLYYRDPLSSSTRDALRVIPHSIEAFSIDDDGTAYMVVNGRMHGYRRTHGHRNPVLISFNVYNASTTAPNVVDVIGEINTNRKIHGVSIDPVSGKLYATLSEGGASYKDRLITIDKSTARITSYVGYLQGSGEVASDAEDLEFDHLGNLYVTDDRDNELYRVDPLTGRILEEIDTNQGYGSVEALAWDPVNEKMVAFDDRKNYFFEQTFQDGHNPKLGRVRRLTDVEGMDFLIPVPLPGTLVLFLGGIFGMGCWKRCRAT
jgi:DNA-binding beta-propeller fold protein YncE